ncbi:hypothetical protein [Olivibacter domesticus]|uniref:hypothetical protein n=1 Tax=Olivibacter domesticus TaxID=407022 RepID=UPI00139020E2|nr:hypothetical protein [Olivibacter domesticus]
MKRHIPFVAMLTGFISFIGIIYMMLTPSVSNIMVFIIYILAACSGVLGLYLMGKKEQ